MTLDERVEVLERETSGHNARLDRIENILDRLVVNQTAMQRNTTAMQANLEVVVNNQAAMQLRVRELVDANNVTVLTVQNLATKIDQFVDAVFHRGGNGQEHLAH